MNFIAIWRFLQHISVGVMQSFLKNMEIAITNFEVAFSSINVSKVNLGKVRRESVSNFIQGFDKLWKLDEFELLDKISDWI